MARFIQCVWATTPRDTVDQESLNYAYCAELVRIKILVKILVKIHENDCLCSMFFIDIIKVKGSRSYRAKQLTDARRLKIKTFKLGEVYTRINFAQESLLPGLTDRRYNFKLKTKLLLYLYQS